MRTTSVKEWTADAGDGFTLTETLVEVDFLQQRTLSYLRYERWQEGKLIESELQRLPVHWYGVGEFTSLLKEQGFADITVCADYQLDQRPTRGGHTLTFMGRKA